MPKKNKSILKYALVLITVVLGLSLMPDRITPTVASEAVTQVVMFRPPNTRAPRRTASGASRDASICNIGTQGKENSSMKALTPTSNIGFTKQDRPAIFVYLPSTNAKEAFFSIQDEENLQHYETTLALGSNGGVMSVKFPLEAPALEPEKNYKWSLAMICGEQLEPDSPLVSGWIRRVESRGRDVKVQNTTPSLKTVQSLASQGIWYDSVSTLAELIRSQPNNPTLFASWQQLLKSAGLEAIAFEPIMN